MKPRPLHRSLSLWSGLLILGFLLWAHRDSTTHHTKAHAYLNGAGLAFSSYPGGASLAFQTGPWIKPGINLDRAFIPPGSEPTTPYPDNPMRPAHQFISLSDGSGSITLHNHVLVLPYWLLIALWFSLWFSLWALLLLWRARRIKA